MKAKRPRWESKNDMSQEGEKISFQTEKYIPLLLSKRKIKAKKKDEKYLDRKRQKTSDSLGSASAFEGRNPLWFGSMLVCSCKGMDIGKKL
jgi:hypothetical protein